MTTQQIAGRAVALVFVVHLALPPLVGSVFAVARQNVSYVEIVSVTLSIEFV